MNRTSQLATSDKGYNKPSYFPQLNKLINKIGRVLANNASSDTEFDTYKLEQLEPRLLLSADPIAAAINLEQSRNDVEVKVVDQKIQIVAKATNSTQEQELYSCDINTVSEAKTVQINGTDINDTLTIHESFLELEDNNLFISFDGKAGEDKVQTASDVVSADWQIDNSKSGSLGPDGIIEFSNIEEIKALANDGDATHTLTSVNKNYQWTINNNGINKLSIVEKSPGSILYDQVAIDSTVSFSGFTDLVANTDDVLDYSQYNSAVSVDLSEGKATGVTNISGFNSIVGSDHADSFIGDSDDNTFIVGFGDNVDADDGSDSVIYQSTSNVSSNIRLDYDDVTKTYSYIDTGNVNNKIFVQNTEFMAALGSDQNDTFDFSNAKDDVTVYLSGKGGNDTLTGGAGDDFFVGGLGSNTITGNTGDDEIIEITFGNSLQINASIITASNSAASILEDRLTSVESIYLQAKEASTIDASTASEFTNGITLIGSDEQDIIRASAYGDTIIGTAGDDSITGGAGSDTFYASFSGIVEYKNNENKLNIGAESTDENIANTVIGFDSNDTIQLDGSDGSDFVDLSEFTGKSIISTFGGNDSVYASQNIATIDAGEGDDEVVVSSFAVHSLEGGLGNDVIIADYSTSASGVSIVLTDRSLSVSTNESSTNSFEQAKLFGSNLDDSIDASTFTGISQSTNLSSINGWDDWYTGKNEIQFSFTDNNETENIGILLNQISTIASLVNTINLTLSEYSYGLVEFDQDNAQFDLSKLTNYVSLTSTDGFLDLFNIKDGQGNSVSFTTNTYLSFTLASSLVTLQKGNGGKDSYIGSNFDDIFQIDVDDNSVTGNDGNDSLSIEIKNSSLGAFTLTDSELKNASESKKISFDDIELVNATTIVDFNASAANMDLILDASTASNITLGGGKKDNTFKIDTNSRANNEKVTLTSQVADQLKNKIVYYSSEIKGINAVEYVDDLITDAYVNAVGFLTTYKRVFSGDIVINKDVSIDKDYEITTVNHSITVNADITTTDNSNLTLSAQDITIGSSGSNGDAVNINVAGDFSLSARHLYDNFIRINTYNYENLSASIEVNNAKIVANNIILSSSAESASSGADILEQYIGATDPDTAIVASVKDYVINYVGTIIDKAVFNSMPFFSFNKAKVFSTITLAENAILEAQNDVDIDTFSYAEVSANQASFLVGASIGLIDSQSIINASGTITAGNDINLTSVTNNVMNVTSAPSSIGGIGLAFAFADIQSVTKVNASGTLIAGNDLNISAKGNDASYVEAISNIGGGILGASILIHNENSFVESYISGTVKVGNNLDISATQTHGTVNGLSGDISTFSLNSVDNEATVPKFKKEVEQKIKQEIFDSSKTLQENWVAKKLLNKSKSTQNKKVAAGAAFIYSNNKNSVSSIVGAKDKTSSIYVANNMDINSKIYAKQSTSASSSTIVLSQNSSSKEQSSKSAKFGAAITVDISSIDNEAISKLQGDTQIDVFGQSNIDSLTRNGNIYTGLTNLQTPSLSLNEPMLVTEDTDVSNIDIKNGDLFEFVYGECDWGDHAPEFENYEFFLHAVYEYIGIAPLLGVDLSQQNFDDGNWQKVGDQFQSLPNQVDFGSDFGFASLNNSSSSTSAGAKVGLAVNVQIFDSKQIANTIVGGNVDFNLNDNFDKGSYSESILKNVTIAINNKREINLDSQSINESVDNIGIKTSKTLYIPYFNLEPVIKSIVNADGNEVEKAKEVKPSWSSQSANGIGAAVYINTVTSKSNTIIESGADLKADKLSVTADNFDFTASLAKNKGKGKGSLGINGAYTLNNIDAESIAQIESGSNVRLTSSEEDALDINAKNKVDLLTVALNAASSEAFSVGAVAANNTVNKVTKSLIGSESGEGLNIADRGSVIVDGGINISSVSNGFIANFMLNTADASKQGDGTPWYVSSLTNSKTEQNEAKPKYGAAISGTVLLNELNSTIESQVYNLNSIETDSLTITADESSYVIAAPLTYSSSSTDQVALSLSATVLKNNVDIDIDAGISRVNSVELNSLIINSTNNANIFTLSVAASKATVSSETASFSSSIAIAGNVSLNTVNSNVDAYVKDVETFSVIKNNSSNHAVSEPFVQISSKDNSRIIAVATGMSYAGAASIGTTIAQNKITGNVKATITRAGTSTQLGSIDGDDSSVSLTANRNQLIIAAAFGAAIAKETKKTNSGAVGLSVGAAIGKNEISGDTLAYIEDSYLTLKKTNLVLDSQASSKIYSVSMAASLSVQTASDTAVSLTGSGAISTNIISGNTSVYIEKSQIFISDLSSSAESAIKINAVSDDDILAIVAAAGASYASSSSSGSKSGSLALGISLAENSIGQDNQHNSVSAYISGSKINVENKVSISARNSSNIGSIVAATSVAIAKSTQGNNGGLSGVGAITKNIIYSDTHAYIADNSQLNSPSALDINAINGSKIDAIVVGAAITASVAGKNNVAVAVGVSLAKNSIANQAYAYIDGSTISNISNLTLNTNNSAQINAVAVAASATLTTGSSLTLSLSGAGADAKNSINGGVLTYIEDSSVNANGDLDLETQSNTKINAYIGAANASLAFGGDVSTAVGIGAVIAENHIGTDEAHYAVNSYIYDSSIITSDDVNISATANEMTINANTAAFSISIATGSKTAIGAASAGVGATNNVYADIDAYVHGGKSLEIDDMIDAKNVTLKTDSAINIDALLISASGGAAGTADGSVAVGASINVVLAKNTIDLSSRSYVYNMHSIKTSGILSLISNSQNTIDSIAGAIAFAVSASANTGVSISIAGSVAKNELKSHTQTYIKGVSSVSSTGAITLNAIEKNEIDSKTTSASLAVAAGSNAVSVAFAASIASNSIDTNVNSYIDGSVISASGNLSLLAEGNSVITSTLIAVSAGVSVSTGSAAVSVTGAASIAQNTLTGGVTTYIKDTSISNVGDITLSSFSSSQIKAYIASATASVGVGAGTGVTLAVAYSDATNNIGTNNSRYQVQSYIYNSKIVTDNDINLNAKTNAMLIDANIITAGLAIAAGSNAVGGGVSGIRTRNFIFVNVDTYLDGGNSLDIDDQISAKNLSLIADSAINIQADLLAASAGVAASGGVSVGANVTVILAKNEIDINNRSYIQNLYSVITSGALTLTTNSHNQINAKAASLLFSVGVSSSASVNISIAASVAENKVNSNTFSYINNVNTITANGLINMQASTVDSIESLSLAASVSLSASAGASVSISGAGSTALNIINGETLAYIKDSILIANDTNSIIINAKNSSTIEAKIGAVSASVAVGVAAYTVSIGAALVSNTIGSESAPLNVNAYVENTEVKGNANIQLLSTSEMDIDALLLAGSGALAIDFSGGGGVPITAAASSALNTIYTNTTSYIKGGQNGSVEAKTLVLNSISNNTIDVSSIATAVSVGGSLSAAVGISLSASTAVNTIVSNTKSYISDVPSLKITDQLNVKSISQDTIKARAFSNSVSLSIGSVGVSVAASGAVATNDIGGSTLSYISKSDIDDTFETSTLVVNIDAQNTSTINALIQSSATGLAGGAFTGVGAAFGVSVAKNNIGSQDSVLQIKSYIEDSQISSAKLLSINATGNMNIDSTVAVASLAIAGSLVGVSGAVAGSHSFNSIYSNIESYIENDDPVLTMKVTNAINILATNKNEISSTVVGGAVAGSVGAVGVSLSIAESLSTNTINADTKAYIKGVSLINTPQGNVNIRAITPALVNNDSNIKAISSAVSIAGSFGGAGFSITGAGASAINTIKGDTLSYVDSSHITATQLTIEAINNAKIDANIVASSAAASAGMASVSGAIGGAYASNNLGTDTKNTTISAYINNAEINTNILNVNTHSEMNIDAFVRVDSIAIAIGIGGAAAGAGVDVANSIYSDVKSQIANSTINALTLDMNTKSASQINADANVNAISGAFPGSVTVSISATNVDNIIDINSMSIIDNSTIQSVTDLTIDSIAHNIISADGNAVAIAAGFGFSSAGVLVRNEIDGVVSTDITSSTKLLNIQSSTISAQDISSQSINATGISGGFIAAGAIISQVNNSVETYVNIEGEYTGTDLTIWVKGSLTNQVDNTAGSGGVAAGAGIGSTINDTSLTRTSINSSNLKLDGNLKIDTIKQDAMGAEINVNSGGLLSGSGLINDNNLTSNVLVELGGRIDAKNIDVNAQNVIDNNGLTNKLDVDAYGLASSAGIDSSTLLDYSTKISILDNTILTTDSDNDIDGIALNTINTINYQEKATLLAAGALAETHANIEIEQKNLTSEIVFGKGVTLETSGDLDVSARTNQDIDTQIFSDSVGAVAIAKTKNEVILKPNNHVTFGSELNGNNTDITVYGNVNVSTGSDTSFNYDAYDFNVTIDSSADAVIPATSTTTKAEIIVDNAILVNEGVSIKTAKNINLHASKYSLIDATILEKCVTWTSKLAGTEALGGDLDSGTNSSVTNNGELKTGITSEQYITFNLIADNDGTSFSNDSFTVDGSMTDGEYDIRYQASTQSIVDSNLIDNYKNYINLLSIFADGNDSADSVQEAYYKAQIVITQDLLKEKGLLEEVKDSQGNVVDYVIKEGYVKPTISIGDVYATPGQIDIRAVNTNIENSNYSIGNGASITVVNHTYASLELSDLTIEGNAGKLLVNGVDKSIRGSGDAPEIIVINDFNVDDNELTNEELKKAVTWPSITVNGNVTNTAVDGKWTAGNMNRPYTPGMQLTTNDFNGKGELTINGTVSASIQTMGTGGKVNINNPGGAYSLSTEYTKWNSLTNDGGISAVNESKVNAQAAAGDTTKTTLYGSSISIDAEYINLNGRIQSGIDAYNLVITQDMENEIKGKLSQNVTNDFYLNTTGYNVSAYFDISENQIVVESIDVDGGYVSLTGHILNTSSNRDVSNISILGGYASIKIENNSSYDINLNKIDVSKKGQGTLIINDVKHDDNVVEKIYKADDPSPVTLYQPEAGWRYAWSMRSVEQEKFTKTIGKSTIFGADWLSKDPDDIKDWGAPETLSGPALNGEGEMYIFDSSLTADKYAFSSVDTVINNPKMRLVDKWSKSSGLFGIKKTYYAKYEKLTKTQTVSTHSIKADYPVSITWTGSDTANINITSNSGGDIIVSDAITNTVGSTSINTTGNISSNSKYGVVGGNAISLNANSIGNNKTDSYAASETALYIDSGNNGIAATANGVLNLYQVGNNGHDLIVNSVTSQNNFVYLGSDTNVLAHGNSANVLGESIEIVSAGIIGNDTNEFTVKSAQANQSYVSLYAKANINVKSEGDLRAQSIYSENGHIKLTINGSLIDADKFVLQDTRSNQEILSGWLEMGLVEGSSQYDNKLAQLELSYKTKNSIDLTQNLTDEQKQEVKAIIVTHTETEILNLLSDSLIKPIIDTQLAQENINITAKNGNVTIVANAGESVGAIAGQSHILLDGSYTTEEKQELLVAERSDVYFLLSKPSNQISAENEIKVENINVNITNQNSVGVITGSTDWLNAGFVAGMNVYIQGNSANANDDGSFYTITNVTSEGIILDKELQVEYSTIIDLYAISNGLNSITLQHTSNWNTNNFTHGDYVKVDGADCYKVASVSNTLLKLDEVINTSEINNYTELNSSNYKVYESNSINIIKNEDIDVDITGSLSIRGELDSNNQTTSLSHIFIGSSNAENNINIGNIQGEKIRLISKNSLNMTENSVITVKDTVNNTGSLILEAANGYIGSENNYLKVYMDNNTLLTARGKNDIFILAVEKNINVGAIYSSHGSVDLFAGLGGIFDGNGNEYENIKAKNITLKAKADIGTDSNYLDINTLGGTITTSANTSINLHETDGDLLVNSIQSDQDIRLKVNNTLLNSTNDSKISAQSIYLSSILGSIGSDTSKLRIDTGSASGENLTLDSKQSVYLEEISGDLYLNTAKAADYIYLQVADGSLVDDRAQAELAANITAIEANLNVNNHIGKNAISPLLTTLDKLQANTTNGDIYIRNTQILGVDKKVLSESGSIVLQATSLDVSAIISANQNLTVSVDKDVITTTNANISATNILLNGSDMMNRFELRGVIQAQDDIRVETRASNDYIYFDATDNNTTQYVGDIYVQGGEGDDYILIDELHDYSRIFELDANNGSDTYVINRRGTGTSNTINVKDTGSLIDADTLIFNGIGDIDTSKDQNDLFLLRKNFIAAMNRNTQGDIIAAAERVNYDKNINARLIIKGLEGDDSFYSDDNSSITTLDGGAGADLFQIGQIYGSERTSSSGNVAYGDDIDTQEINIGYLSKGNSLPMVVLGGSGNDTINVYSNKGLTKLYGDDGDDNFTVRSFLLKDSNSRSSLENHLELFAGDGADNIQYNINSELDIDGGKGYDNVVVLGTEANDNFMITSDGIYGAGLTVSYTNVEYAETDGLEGDDTFYVLSTNEAVTTTVIGGLGSDTFYVAGDVTDTIYTNSIEGSKNYITHGMTSSDPTFNKMPIDSVQVNVRPSSSQSTTQLNTVEITPDNGLSNLLEGEISSYNISIEKPTLATLAYLTVSAVRSSNDDKLTQPQNSVLVSLSKNGTYAESLVIEYDSDSWNKDTKIYVKAANDVISEGNITHVISHSMISDNTNYDKVDIPNVDVTVNDDDAADIVITRSSQMFLTEGNENYITKIGLTKAPQNGEVITIKLDETFNGSQSNQLSLTDSNGNKISELIFTKDNWNQSQTLHISTLDDDVIEFAQEVTLSFSATSSLGSNSEYVDKQDALYITVNDDDRGGAIITQTNESTVIDSNTNDVYSLVLTKQPTSNVEITLNVDSSIFLTSLDSRFNNQVVTFTTENWNKPIDILVQKNLSNHSSESNNVTIEQQFHSVNQIRGNLILEGGVMQGKERTLINAVTLPTESNIDFTTLDIYEDESQNIDRLSILNDGVGIDTSGTITDTIISGFGMNDGKSISYTSMEVVDIYSGTGNDVINIKNTASNAITTLHAGGGSDNIVVESSAENGALILLGDAQQDGADYNLHNHEKGNAGHRFSKFGNDFIDASGAKGSVAIYGGQGNDTLIGSNSVRDYIAGGSGNDKINGQGGNDIIYGDSGINVDTSILWSKSVNTISIVNTLQQSPLADAQSGDLLTVGEDFIQGGSGDDIIFADKGDIEYVSLGDIIKSTSVSNIVSLSNSAYTEGADNEVYGNAGNDFILGGAKSDIIFGNTDNDAMISDFGKIELTNGVATYLVSQNTSLGGSDTIDSGDGKDGIIAGFAADTVTNQSGETVILGDNGYIRNDEMTERYISISTGSPQLGASDRLTGGSDRDIIIGGVGNDVIDGGTGNDILMGDGSTITHSGNKIEAYGKDLEFGGDDTLIAGSGFDHIQGQGGADLLYTNFSQDIAIGDSGTFYITESGSNSTDTVVVTLSLGRLDLINQKQTDLYEGKKQSVLAHSPLGMVAQSRTNLEYDFSAEDKTNNPINDLGNSKIDMDAFHHSRSESRSLIIPGSEITLPANNQQNTPSSNEGNAQSDLAIADQENPDTTSDGQDCDNVVDGKCVISNDNPLQQNEEEPIKNTDQENNDNNQQQPKAEKNQNENEEPPVISEGNTDDNEKIDLKSAVVGIGGWAIVAKADKKNQDRRVA